MSAPDDESHFDLALSAHAAINKAKADGEVSMGREVERMTLATNAATGQRLGAVLSDVLQAARCLSHTLTEDEALEDGVIEVRDPVFAPKPQK